ncbi:DUF6894 family protein [Methylorubrum extorquens]|jgi:hypothetical protein
MTRYFFDICDDFLSVTDTEGEECADLQKAGDRAATILCEIAGEMPLKDGRSDMRATVRDDADNVVFTATLNIMGRAIEHPVRLEQRAGTRLATSYTK